MTYNIGRRVLVTLPQPHPFGAGLLLLGTSCDKAADQIFAIHPQAVFERGAGEPLTLKQFSEALGPNRDFPGGHEGALRSDEMTSEQRTS